MTTTERETARARARARRKLADQLAKQLADLAREAAELAGAADRLDADDPAAVLDLLARLADNARKPRPAAVADRLLSDARTTAVHLARANSADRDRGITWTRIGAALGSDRRNAQGRYSTRGDDQR